MTNRLHYCDGCGASVGRTMGVLRFCNRCHNDTFEGRTARRVANGMRRLDPPWTLEEIAKVETLVKRALEAMGTPAADSDE